MFYFFILSCLWMLMRVSCYFVIPTVLSQRLGLGKGGIRMAPEEALAELLQVLFIVSSTATMFLIWTGWPFLMLWFFLKVSLGCVTPFAVVNESARYRLPCHWLIDVPLLHMLTDILFENFLCLRDVSLLLDQKFKNQTRCIFHPLSNDVSICKFVLRFCF